MFKYIPSTSQIVEQIEVIQEVVSRGKFKLNQNYRRNKEIKQNFLQKEL